MIVNKSLHEKVKYVKCVNENLDSRDSIRVLKQDMENRNMDHRWLFIVTSTGKKWSTNT